MLNAINFVNLLESIDKGDKSNIINIIEDEHKILQELIDVFLKAPKNSLNDSEELTVIMFIITTIVENITKLNKIIGRHFDNIDLHKSYEYILDVVGYRMDETDYHTSFLISYSHALIHTKMAIASGYYYMGNFKDAYEITKKLLSVSDKYDITGNYRAFILNAHGIYCEKIGRLEESIESFERMAVLYYDYNEHYMVKLAINKINKLIKGNSILGNTFWDESLMYLLDDKINFPEEAYLITSTPLDLENNLLAGLEQKIFYSRGMEISSYTDKEMDDLKATFRAYEHWRNKI